MKQKLLFLLLICITATAAAQSKQYFQHTSVDQNGKKSIYYKTISGEEEKSLSRSIAKNIDRQTKNGDPVYETSLIDYTELKKELSQLTGRTYDDKIFLLEYTYANDSCTGNNIWDQKRVKNRKEFLLRQKKEIEKRNKEVVILNFFEEGIALANSPNSSKEYFFKDKENILRNSLFTKPTSCGSFALIKPTGETLVSNGENYAWYMEQHLKPETWTLFFPKN